MNIKLFVSNYTVDAGKPTHKSSCAIVALANVDNVTKCREMSSMLEPMINQASELCVAYYALLSIKPAFRTNSVELWASQSIAKILEKQGDLESQVNSVKTEQPKMVKIGLLRTAGKRNTS